jgi:hypothetical protein
MRRHPGHRVIRRHETHVVAAIAERASQRQQRLDVAPRAVRCEEDPHGTWIVARNARI